MKRQEYLNTHSKEEILDKVLSYREIAQNLQERIAELEKLLPNEIERDNIYAGQLQSKCTLRELFGYYMNHPQKVLEYPLDKKDIAENFHRKIYLALEYVAKMGFKEIAGPEISEYLKEHCSRFYKSNGRYVDEFVLLAKRWGEKKDLDVAKFVEDMKKWTVVRESFKQGKDISWFYGDGWDTEPMERFQNTSLKEMQEYFDKIPAVEKINDLLPELY